MFIRNSASSRSKNDPRVHRVVHLTYRVGKRDLSYPRPQVDLTTRQVETPEPRAARAGAQAAPAHAMIESRAKRRPGRDLADGHRRDPACSFLWLAPVRYCALCLLAVMPSAANAQPDFFASALADPPAQEVTTEFLISESGGHRAAQRDRLEGSFARGVHKGLYITGAWFKRDLGEDWIKVLNDARVAELFVPYHQSSYIRYYDLTSFSVSLERGQGRRRRAVRHA